MKSPTLTAMILKNRKRFDERIARNPRFARPEVLEMHAKLAKLLAFRGFYEANKWDFRDAKAALARREAPKYKAGASERKTDGETKS
jgi:hypothetical protein